MIDGNHLPVGCAADAATIATKYFRTPGAKQIHGKF